MSSTTDGAPRLKDRIYILRALDALHRRQMELLAMKRLLEHPDLHVTLSAGDAIGGAVVPDRARTDFNELLSRWIDQEITLTVRDMGSQVNCLSLIIEPDTPTTTPPPTKE